MALLFDGKTPKMLAVEICAKKKLVLTWTPTEVQKTPSVFHVVASVEGLPDGKVLKEEGHGTTKKDAEQVVSARLIPKLITSEELISMTAACKELFAGEKRVLQILPKNVSPQPTTASAVVVEESGPQDRVDSNITPEVEIKGEPVGELITYCLRLRISNPTFEASMNNISNMHTVTASAGGLTHTATHLKKVEAKKVAAYHVLRQLKVHRMNANDKQQLTTSVSINGKQEEVSSSGSSYCSSGAEQMENSYIKIEMDHSSSSGPSSSCSSNGSRTPESSVGSSENEINEIETDRTQNNRKRTANCTQEGGIVFLANSPPCKISKQDNDDSVIVGSSTIASNNSSFITKPVISDENPKRLKDSLVESDSSSLDALMDLAEEMNATLKFHSVSSRLVTESADKNLVILTIVMNGIESGNSLEGKLQKKHTVSGVGNCVRAAKEDAATNALKLLCPMLLSD